MKKLMSIFMVALLALGANVSAQEEGASGASASGTAATSTIGGIATSTVVIGAVAVGVAAAIIANQDDDDPFSCPEGQIPVGETCTCPTGQTLVNGVCIPDELTPVCDQGGELDGDVCVVEELVTQTVTISVDGTITTTLTQVPVIRTYEPSFE